MIVNTDWALLRKQKEYLVAMASDDDRPTEEIEVLDGIIHFIDAIQDEAVFSGDADTLEVFGEPS